ncbi:hypothetical protein [Frankia sp. Cas4]|uniref:hypothetical protein n=1 Tax=Frankia sp. Cas4 TaxID=3073927 RepID=UPI002AD2230E|nr:hypothetical protein [Frankia sp. Cas4]
MDDVEWRRWLIDLVTVGATEFDAETTGECVIGSRGRTAGSRVTVAGGGPDRWLRVVTERLGWGGGPTWIGNMEASAVLGVARPEVLAVTEWEEAGRQVRTELMTLAPGGPLASDIALREHVSLDASWWTALRRSVDVLAASTTDRVCLDADLIRHRLLAAFGVEIATESIVWSTAHGDLHWANITGPICWLLDWEAWGAAPAGYDAATLYCSSLLQPEIADQVFTVFGDLLSSSAGAVAHLVAAAKLLGLVEYGDHPDLAAPLHRHARRILRRHYPESLGE